MMRFRHVLMLTYFFCHLFAFTNAQPRVLDSRTHEPVTGAFLMVTEAGQQFKGATDAQGFFHKQFRLPARLSLKAIGYREIKDSLLRHLPDIIYLEAVNTSLEEVAVSSRSLQATTVPHNNYHTQVFSQELIAQKGAVNMGDLLNTTLNAKVMNNGDDGSSLLLQGLSGQNVKILVDGIPQVLGMSNEFDLQQLNLTNVERVELVEGPLSVQYGTNALAGTLNIITRKMDTGKDWGIGLHGFMESIGQYNTGFWLGKNWKGWNTTLDVSYNRFPGYASDIYRSRINNPTHTVRGYNWSPKRMLNGTVKVYRRWKGLDIGLQHNQLHQVIDNKGEQDAGTAYLTANDHWNVTDRWNTSLYAHGILGNKALLDLTNSYGQYRLAQTEYLVNVQNATRKVLENPVDRFHTWTFRGSYATATETASAWDMQLGYDMNLNGGQGESIADTARAINDYGLYGGLGVKVWRVLAWRGQLRYIYNNRYDASSINWLGAGLPIVPALSAKWQVAAGLSAAVAYTKAFRAPAFLELYREFINGSHYLIGNALLVPELANNYQTMVEWHTGAVQRAWHIRLSFYSNRIHNKIELVQPTRASLPPQYQDIQVPRTYTNIPLFKTRGVNLSVEYLEGDRLSFRPGFAWLARSGSNSLGIFYNSYDVNAQAMYRLPKTDIRLVAFYKYNGAMAQFGLDEDGHLVDQRLGDYHLLDVSANKSFWHSMLNLTLGVKNLLGVTDVWQTGDGTAGLVAGTDVSAVPIAWGRTAFIKAALNL